MTDTDPRLEAVALVLRDQGYSRLVALTDATEFVLKYDALRAFDQAQRKAAFDDDHPRCPHCGERDGFHIPSCIRALHRAFEYGKRFVSDQLPLPGFVSAAAKEAGEAGRGLADPPWLVQCMDVAFAGMTGLIEAERLEVLRCAIAFANAQPPSGEAVEEAYRAYRESESDDVREIIRETLIAAAKARSGA